MVVKYDVIAIGTGSAMNIVEAMLNQDENLEVAVIDKDPPGGICLTKACIPTKILLYPSELINHIEKAKDLGVDVQINNIDFPSIMKRMHSLIDPDIEMVREGLSSTPNIGYYTEPAEFVEPYTLKVGEDTITAPLIFLCTGSKPFIPSIKGLDKVSYHTSDTILNIEQLPESLVIVGGGFVAAEYGDFFSSMGSKVTILGRNPQFLPGEEEEVSAVLIQDMSKKMDILTNHEVIEIEEDDQGKITTAVNRETGEEIIVNSQEVLIAAGRASNSDILSPQKGGIDMDENGWIRVNEYLETSQSNVWAMGDALGKHLFKHVANYESRVVYHNAVRGEQMEVDYHAVPHAVFTYPEVAAVGMGEKEAIDKLGKDRVIIGFDRYEDNAKGNAMGAKNYFAKILLDAETERILGAHIVGPYASILIHEIVNLMYTAEQTPNPVFIGMHIHPALSEVVKGAFNSLMDVDSYHHMLEHKLPEINLNRGPE
ncbi:MAG: dihydrolipoyl dehydrogenase [Archaeoglobaceae archaeon]